MTQRPSELLPNLAKSSISVTSGSCAGHWWEGFCNWWCWLIPAAKVPVKLESVREDLRSGGPSHGELVDAASLIVAPPPPSLTSHKNATRRWEFKRQNSLDFCFLVYVCVNVHLLTILCKSILCILVLMKQN